MTAPYRIWTLRRRCFVPAGPPLPRLIHESGRASSPADSERATDASVTVTRGIVPKASTETLAGQGSRCAVSTTMRCWDSPRGPAIRGRFPQVFGPTLRSKPARPAAERKTGNLDPQTQRRNDRASFRSSPMTRFREDSRNGFALPPPKVGVLSGAPNLG